jgi:thiamine transport system permease protein
MHAWRPRNAVQFGLVAGPLVFLGLFFVWPVAELLVRGLGDADVAGVFASASIRSALWFTFWQAALSTVLTVLVAFPLTWAVANIRFPGRRAVRAFVTVPFVLPTVVVAGAFIATADRLGLTDGPFALNGGVFAILVAHVFFNVAVVVRTVGSYWSQLSADDEFAARMLGASPIRTFATITLARLRPAIAAAVAIVFLFTFTSFGVVLILGSSRERTIETEIYRYAISRTDFGTAAVLSVVQLVTVLVLVVVNQRLRGRIAGSDRLTLDRARPVSGVGQRMVVALVLGFTLAALAVPVVSLIDQSLRSGGGLSFTHYRALDDRPPFLTVSPLRAIGNSLAFGAVAALLATVVGGWAAVAVAFSRRTIGRLVDLAFLLPLGTSAVTLGFGVLLAFDSGVFDLRQSWFIIPLVQSLIGVPFVTRAVAPVLLAIDPHLREAASSLGADPRRVLRDIDLPIARRALTVGAGFAFAISLGEFGATSFVGRRPDFMTVPLAIARLLSQPGQQIRGQAMALSVILMLLTTAVLLALDRADRTVL